MNVEINTEQFKKIMNDYLRDFSDKIFAESQNNLLLNDSINEGTLLKSGNVIKKGDLHYQVVYSAPHAEPIEYGTSPHMPPVGPIIKWVQLKLAVNNKRQAEHIAWAIAKEIKRRGTSPTPFLRPAIDKILKSI